MARFNVFSLSQPELLSDPKDGFDQVYGAEVLVEPPFNPGDGLADCLSGNPGSIIMRHVTTKGSRTHLHIETQSVDYDARTDVAGVISRLTRYLNASDDELVANLFEYRQNPLMTEYSPRKM